MSVGKISGLSTAVGQEILGLMYSLKPQPTTADLEMAHALFTKAATALPYNSDARNLQIIGGIRSAGNSPQLLLPRKTADNLISAIAVDPEN
jgi:hypothetical protein